MAKAELGEVGLAALIVVVQIDEGGGDALADARDLLGIGRDLRVQKVEMVAGLLARPVVEDGESLHHPQG